MSFLDDVLSSFDVSAFVESVSDVFLCAPLGLIVGMLFWAVGWAVAWFISLLKAVV